MSELDTLAIKYQTDKSSEYHGYTKYYEHYFKEYKDANIALIEIGVGSYENENEGGHSLRMWYDYFRRGKLTGIDIFPKTNIINDRTEFWQGNQTDKHLLKTIIKRNIDADIRIIIDDASHDNTRTIETFRIIFPMLKGGDLYFIEDVHTSYYETEEFNGKELPGVSTTTMGFFTAIAHELNWEHLLPEYRNEYAGKLEFIHFYKEMIVIKKL